MSQAIAVLALLVAGFCLVLFCAAAGAAFTVWLRDARATAKYRAVAREAGTRTW